jgi:uncharacterized membrane protein YbhN (UPF0104 family)
VQWRWSGTIAALLLIVILVLLSAWTQAAKALGSARIEYLLPAAVCYSAGFLIFSAVWAFLVTKGSDPPRSADSASFYFSTIRVSNIAIAGLLTPMNLGTDVLRSILGKKYLHLGVSSTAAASILTRECKLHVTLFLIPALAYAAGAPMESSRSRLLLLFSGMLGLALVLFLFRSGSTTGLSRLLGLECLANQTRLLSRRIGWRMRLALYFLFTLAFAAESQALRLCFWSVGVPMDFRLTFVCFGIFYFLSRTPVLPLGIGVVEMAGYALLRALNIPVEQAGALIVVWGFLRVVVPYSLAGANFFGKWLPLPEVSQH